MVRLILSSSFIVACVGGKIERIDSYEKSDSMLDMLFRYEMMKKSGLPDSRNPYTEDVKRAFESFNDGVYVMSIYTADTLAKTGRKMDDICIYEYQDNVAVIRRYNNRNTKL